MAELEWFCDDFAILAQTSFTALILWSQFSQFIKRLSLQVPSVDGVSHAGYVFNEAFRYLLLVLGTLDR